MDLRKIFFSTLFFLILGTGLAFSYDNLGTSARAVGMGNAFVAVADDPSTVFYNPAGLARLRGVHFSMMYDRGSVWGYALDEKPYVGFGSLVYPLSGNSGVLAFSGGRKASWSSNSQIVGQNILSLSYARSIGPMSSVGLNAKLLSNSKVDKKTGFEVDFGLLFPITDRFSFGLAGENLLGTDMTPDSGVMPASPQTPSLFNYSRRQYKVGMSVSLPTGTNSTRIAYDVIVKDKKNFSSSTPYLNSLGVEQGISLIPGNAFFLRAGYTFGKDYNQDYKQWAWGISYKVATGSNTIQIDYSYQSYPFETQTSLVGDHRLGLTIGFGFAKHPDYFSKNKSQTNFAKQEESKKDKTAEISKEVKPSTTPIQPEKQVSDQTLVKKEKPKISQPTTPTSTPSTPMVTTPSSSGTKVATTEKSTVKTPVSTTSPTPDKSTTTSGKTQVATTNKSKVTTATSTTLPTSTSKTPTPEKTPVVISEKPKSTVTTPATTPSSTTKAAPTEKTTVGKSVTAEKTKVTPAEKSKPTTVSQTPTTTTKAQKTVPTTTTPTTDKTKSVSVTKAPTTTTPETKVTAKEKPVTTTSDKSKTTTVTQTPATKSTTPVTPSVQPKTTTVTKQPTATSTAKVTPTEKTKPTTVTKTPTATTATKITPATKSTSSEKSVTPPTPKVSPTDKSKEITLAQVTPKEEVTPIPALQKTKEIFEPLKVSAKMEKIQTQSVRKKSNSYMFIFKAGLDEEQDAIVDWKVYVCSAMPKSNDWEQISAVLVKTLEGRGNLPSGILWDASPETQMLPSVYYALQIKTALGKKYFTAWQTGKMVK